MPKQKWSYEILSEHLDTFRFMDSVMEYCQVFLLLQGNLF